MPRHQLRPLTRVWVISRGLKLGRKLLDRESVFAVGGAPLLVAVEQLGCGDLEPRRDDQLLGNKLFQVVHLLLPTLRG